MEIKRIGAPDAVSQVEKIKKPEMGGNKKVEIVDQTPKHQLLKRLIGEVAEHEFASIQPGTPPDVKENLTNHIKRKRARIKKLQEQLGFAHE